MNTIPVGFWFTSPSVVGKDIFIPTGRPEIITPLYNPFISYQPADYAQIFLGLHSRVLKRKFRAGDVIKFLHKCNVTAASIVKQTGLFHKYQEPSVQIFIINNRQKFPNFVSKVKNIAHKLGIQFGQEEIILNIAKKGRLHRSLKWVPTK